MTSYDARKLFADRADLLRHFVDVVDGCTRKHVEQFVTLGLKCRASFLVGGNLMRTRGRTRRIFPLAPLALLLSKPLLEYLDCRLVTPDAALTPRLVRVTPDTNAVNVRGPPTLRLCQSS